MDDNNRPTHRVYLVEEGRDENDTAYWTEIGGAWPHKDGKGYGITLKGRLVMRKLTDEPMT
jgi:hypothetical protein